MPSQKGIVRFGYARQFIAGCETYFIAPTAWYYVQSLGQNQLFLAIVLCSFNIAVIIGGPLFGRIVDWFGHPRLIFLFTCILKLVSYIVYSINVSAYFPLVGRIISGLGAAGGGAIILGQVALQTEVKDRSATFVMLEGMYCLGATFGPAVGSFVTFDVTVWGWHINQGNSPGVVLLVVYIIFSIVTMLLPKDIWLDTEEDKEEIKSLESQDEGDITDQSSSSNDPKDDQNLTELHPKVEQSLTEHDTNVDRHLNKDYPVNLPENSQVKPGDRRTVADSVRGKAKIEWSARILCLLFLTFTNEVFSSTATFYVPILAIDHYHLELLHVKLYFLNCTLFTLLVFVLFSLASGRIDERKLFLIALGMQFAAVSLLTLIGFMLDHTIQAQNYVLLLYICLGMPYFAFPFCNSILSKITDPRNAAFYQGSSFASMHCGIVASRVALGFVNTKRSLIIYCFVLGFLWTAGFLWFGSHYKRFSASEQKHKGFQKH